MERSALSGACWTLRGPGCLLKELKTFLHRPEGGVRVCGPSGRRRSSLSLTDADSTLGDVLLLLGGLAQRGGAVSERGQPEAVDVGEEVAGSSGALTLHERVSSELRQATS